MLIFFIYWKILKFIYETKFLFCQYLSFLIYLWILILFRRLFSGRCVCSKSRISYTNFCGFTNCKNTGLHQWQWANFKTTMMNVIYKRVSKKKKTNSILYQINVEVKYIWSKMKTPFHLSGFVIISLFFLRFMWRSICGEGL